MTGYIYRGRGLSPSIMTDLILELFTGEEAVRTRTIRQKCEQEHRQRGGAPTPENSLKGSFKKACADLKGVGAIEDAGQGYWHIIGWNYSEDIHDAIRRNRPKRVTRPGKSRHYLKLEMYGRQQGRCAKCDHHFDRVEDLTIDHIVPRDAEGSDEPENLQLLCLTCNSAKGNRA